MLFLQGWTCLKIPVRLCKDLNGPLFWDSGSIPILRCGPPNRNRFTAFQSFFLSDQLPLPQKWTAQASWPFAAHVEITFTETVAPLGLTSFLADPSLFFARHARCGCQYWQTVPSYQNGQEIRGPFEIIQGYPGRLLEQQHVLRYGGGWEIWGTLCPTYDHSWPWHIFTKINVYLLDIVMNRLSPATPFACGCIEKKTLSKGGWGQAE